MPSPIPRTMSTGCGALLVLMLLVTACPGSRVCDPGRVVRCPCLGGLEGVQTCHDDGRGYGPCTGCTGTDAGIDATPDVPDLDRPGPDTPDAALPRDLFTPESSLTDVGDRCVYPTAMASRTPTSGACEGSVTFNCDRATGTMQRRPCATGERCVLLAVHQVGTSGTTPAQPDYRYHWAICRPEAAPSCLYEFSDLGNFWGALQSPRCEGTAAVAYCTMGLPEDFPTNAGTAAGFYTQVPCHMDEHCLEDRCVLGDTPCAEDDWRCDDDATRLGCDRGDLPRRQPCYADSRCVPVAGCTGSRVRGACLANEILSATVTCDPASYPGGCGPGGGVLRCSGYDWECWGESACRCAVTEQACFGAGTTCQAFTDPTTHLTTYECRPAVSCTAGSRCEGAQAIRCDTAGRPTVTDCASLGMTCATAGAVVGCVAGVTTCTGDMRDCTSAGLVTGCCDVSGLFSDAVRMVPCLPGRQVSLPCPMFPGAPPYHCFHGFCTTM